MADSAAAKPEKLLRHVVLFKFKDSRTPEDVKKVVEAFAALPKQIDAIADFEMGIHVRVENYQGFTHCFLVTFRDAKGATRTCRTRCTRPSKSWPCRKSTRSWSSITGPNPDA